MIEKINNAVEFDEWKKRDIFSVRILALIKSYGTQYRFASFYRQVIDGKVTAILSKLDNNFTLSVVEGFEREELVHFFCVTGYSSILSSDKFLFSERFEEGIVMKSDTKREPAIPNGITVDEYPKLMDLYNFTDYSSQDFKAWYVDISHRIRHNTAKAYTLVFEGEIISSGILSSIIDGYSLLTAVRTENDFRNMGYGSALVSYICNDVSGTVYLMRDINANESFYNRLGFENIEKWRIYR